MRAKPQTTAAPPAPIEPPSGLCPKAEALWRQLVPRRARSPERRALLLVALEALTRAEEASALLSREGLTVETKKTGTVHAHPMLKVEKEARGLFLRAWQQLHLEWGPIDSQGNGGADG